MISSRGSWLPTLLLAAGCGMEIVRIEFIKASASQTEFFGGHRGGEFLSPEGRKHLADQRSAETMGKLAIMFFIDRRMAQARQFAEQIPPALRAFRRLSLRSSLLQARRAGGVRLCSHTCPGLFAHCSPLLAARQHETALQDKKL